MAMQSLTISLLQTELFWEDKEANMRMLESKINAIPEKPELIVLPEMFTTGFTMNAEALAEPMDGKSMNWLSETAHKKKAAIVGSIIIEEEGYFFNRLVLMLPNRQYFYYDKRHLFSYAQEHKYYAAGTRKFIGNLNGWKINFQVCYDLRFPVWARQSSDPQLQYDIYLNVANWPEKRRNAWQTLLAARAIENQCYVVGVNRVGKDGNGHLYSGDSRVIDPLGNIIWTQEYEPSVHTYTFEKQPLQDIRSHFPFLKDADEFRILN